MSDEKVELKVTTERSDSKMYFRMGGATADLPDGRQLAVEPILSGAGIVVTVRNVDKTSYTYFFDAQALCSAVLEHENLLTAQKKSEEPIDSLIARSSLGAPFAEPPEAELDIAVAELRRIEEESPEE